eukprot:1521614-Amphidinium_carterae.1
MGALGTVECTLEFPDVCNFNWRAASSSSNYAQSTPSWHGTDKPLTAQNHKVHGAEFGWHHVICQQNNFLPPRNQNCTIVSLSTSFAN